MRNIKLDNFKGILIILVIFAHLLITNRYVEINDYNYLVNFIYVFHMPLFFMIAGELSKRIKVKRIIYYVILFLLMYSSFLLYDYFTYGSYNLFDIKYSSWFILLLLLYRLILCNKGIKKLLDNNYILGILIIFLLLSGYLPINILFLRFFYFFIFFIIGNKKKIRLNKTTSYILLPIILISVGVIAYISRLDLLMGGNYLFISDLFIRVFVIGLNILLYYVGKTLITYRRIPLVTDMGVYSLYIYVLHRIPTLILSDYLYIYNSYIIMVLFLTIIIGVVIVLLAKYIKVIFEHEVFQYLVIVLLLSLVLISFIDKKELNVDKQNEIDESISIGFIGDLLLLEDQLNKSNNNFDYMFDNMSNYFDKTDYVIGVLEGPVDDGVDYSYGNFDDNKELRLNYPTSFLNSIKKANIDLVSIANNHMFDRGIDTYNNTLNNLKENEMDYVGNKNNYKIIDVKGLKIGILAYGYETNYEEEAFKREINYLVDPNDSNIKEIKNNIKKDFDNIKKENVDIIIVIPHYGTQFSERIDIMQEYYNRLFVSLGADIILGDHAHTIQPIYYYGDSIVINCPGNYINSYINYNGDISMFVKVYINKDKKVIGSSITPIIAEKNNEGLYYPVTMEMNSEKTEKALNIIERVIYHREIKDIRNTYYYLKDKQLKYDNLYRLKLLDSDKESLVYKKIQEHKKICFIGDSITEGTVNGYHPWYEALMNYFNDKEVVNISKGGYKSKDIINSYKDIIIDSDCDLNIINIGTNDIRHNGEYVEDYINNIKEMISYMDGEVIILAPWETTSRDVAVAKNNYKKKLYSLYNNKLKELDNIYFINPNGYIKKAIEYNGENYYLLDGVHPNKDVGVKLYSLAVLRSD